MFFFKIQGLHKQISFWRINLDDFGAKDRSIGIQVIKTKINNKTFGVLCFVKNNVFLETKAFAKQ
jgi:hypothetical protein